jgi:hypothetical protein
MHQAQTIPLYSPDGVMRDRISMKRLMTLQELGRIAKVVTQRKGHIKRAILVQLPGEPKPNSLRDYVGTKYSFRQRLDDGHVTFRLRALGDNPNGPEAHLAPDSVRPIFLRVLLDCLRFDALVANTAPTVAGVVRQRDRS